MSKFELKLDKIKLENKALILLGDFNADLLKYHTHSGILKFLDLMHSSLLLHTITIQLVLQQHQQLSLIIYSTITATLHTPLIILSHCLIIMLTS